MPTAAPGTNTPQAASTAFVAAALSSLNFTGYARLEDNNNWQASQMGPMLQLVSGQPWDAARYQEIQVENPGGVFVIANPINYLPRYRYAVTVYYLNAGSIAWGSEYRGLSGITPSGVAGRTDQFFFRSTGWWLDLTGYRLDIGGA